MIVPFYPNAFIWPNFFFPYGHYFFQAINAVACGIEDTLIPVPCCTSNKCGDVANVQPANTLHDGHAFYLGPAFPYFTSNLSHFGFGHLAVGFIF